MMSLSLSRLKRPIAFDRSKHSSRNKRRGCRLTISNDGPELMVCNTVDFRVVQARDIKGRPTA